MSKFEERPYFTYNNPLKDGSHGFTPELIEQIITFIQTNKLPPNLDKDAIARFHGYYKQNDFWKVKDGKLWFKGKEVVANDKVQSVLQSLYNDPATTANGRDKFYWTVAQRYAGITRKMVVRVHLHYLHYLHHFGSFPSCFGAFFDDGCWVFTVVQPILLNRFVLEFHQFLVSWIARAFVS